jgi:hypothetical protein
MTVSKPPISSRAAGDAAEPSPPQRGLTREKRGRDVSQAQATAEAQTSPGRRMLHFTSLPFVLSQAEGYPVVIKQFLQFCLLLIYPAWVFAVAVGAAIYYPVYFVLWVLFWPVRMMFKKANPEEYAANRERHRVQ